MRGRLAQQAVTRFRLKHGIVGEVSVTYGHMSDHKVRLQGAGPMGENVIEEIDFTKVEMDSLGREGAEGISYPENIHIPGYGNCNLRDPVEVKQMLAHVARTMVEFEEKLEQIKAEAGNMAELLRRAMVAEKEAKMQLEAASIGFAETIKQLTEGKTTNV